MSAFWNLGGAPPGISPVGQPGQVPVVNDDGNGLEYKDIPLVRVEPAVLLSGETDVTVSLGLDEVIVRATPTEATTVVFLWADPAGVCHFDSAPGSDIDVNIFIANSNQLIEGYSNTRLREIVRSESFPENIDPGNIVRDENLIVDSIIFEWPDGTPGVFTTTGKNTDPPAINAFTVTYGSRTVTQPPITRDANGTVTALPTLVIT